MSFGTCERLSITNSDLIWTVKSIEQFTFDDFIVLPFDTQHDAAEPLGYLIQEKSTGQKLLFATDSYYIKYKFSKLNYIMIECNYCTEILERNIENGYLASGLADRLKTSHFSLNNIKEFLKANDLRYCKKIILLHLSDGNSDARQMVSEIQTLTGIETVVAEKGLNIDLGDCPF